MHPANEVYWKSIKTRYAEYFTEDILEVGSWNINGSVKDFVAEGCQRYVGVDWRPGPYVDVVSLAHEMNFLWPFKAVISASMLEHDPHWEKSLERMLNYVRSDGIFIVTWGSAKSPTHCEAEAPDGKFHALKGEPVKNRIEELGFTITELAYSKNIHHIMGCPPLPDNHFVLDGSEEINIVAFPTHREVVYIDDFIPEDLED